MKTPGARNRIANQPLRAEAEGLRLVISIGLSTLAFSAEHQDGNPKLKVVNKKALGEDVCHELMAEDEIGATILTDLLDAAVTKACDNGSVAFDHDAPVPER
jgi:hypothetical protein